MQRRTFVAAFTAALAGCGSTSEPETETTTAQTTTTVTTTSPPPTTTTVETTETTTETPTKTETETTTQTPEGKAQAANAIDAAKGHLRSAVEEWDSFGGGNLRRITAISANNVRAAVIDDDIEKARNKLQRVTDLGTEEQQTTVAKLLAATTFVEDVVWAEYHLQQAYSPFKTVAPSLLTDGYSESSFDTLRSHWKKAKTRLDRVWEQVEPDDLEPVPNLEKADYAVKRQRKLPEITTMGYVRHHSKRANEAFASWNEGVMNYRDENYKQAIEHFNDAHERFTTLATALDDVTVPNYFDSFTAKCGMPVMADVTDYMGQAAEAMKNDHEGSADVYMSKSDQAVDNCEVLFEKNGWIDELYTYDGE